MFSWKGRNCAILIWRRERKLRTKCAEISGKYFFMNFFLGIQEVKEIHKKPGKFYKIYTPFFIEFRKGLEFSKKTEV